MNRRILSGVALGLAAAVEGLSALARHEVRRTLFEAARRRAVELGRPLVVVGDPDAGLHTRLARAYPCGDICVDLHGCPACPVQLVADLTAERLPFDDDSVVVFVSCVLEYVGDLKSAAAELQRVAGDNVFLVTVEPWTITAALYPGATWRGLRSEDKVRFEPVSPVRKALYAGSLAALFASALIPRR